MTHDELLEQQPSARDARLQDEHNARRYEQRMAPPTVEWQRCWACVDGFVQDGRFDTPQGPCPICRGKGQLPYELRRCAPE